MAAKRDIPGTLGAAISGSGAPGIGELTKLARRWGGLEESSLLVLSGKLPAPQPALINTAMGHALDFDDTFDRAAHIHSSTSVLAASLAAAESVRKVSGQPELLAGHLDWMFPVGWPWLRPWTEVGTEPQRSGFWIHRRRKAHGVK